MSLKGWQTMTAKNRITLSAISAVVIVICLLLAYRAPNRPSQTKTQAPSETADTGLLIAPPPLTRSDSGPTRNAARSIRAAVIGSAQRAAPLTPKTDAPAIDPERHVASSKSDTASSTPVAKTPQQLLSRFTDDDPTQVFQPESVRYHSAVEAEPVDPDWGAQAQAELQDFFTLELAQYNPYVTADCRTDLCELQIVADGTDAKMFYEALRAFKQHGFWNALDFDQDTGSISYDGGKTVLVYFFSRM
jgi:hypothetical protein